MLCWSTKTSSNRDVEYVQEENIEKDKNQKSGKSQCFTGARLNQSIIYQPSGVRVEGGHSDSQTIWKPVVEEKNCCIARASSSACFYIQYLAWDYEEYDSICLDNMIKADRSLSLSFAQQNMMEVIAQTL